MIRSGAAIVGIRSMPDIKRSSRTNHNLQPRLHRAPRPTLSVTDLGLADQPGMKRSSIRNHKWNSPANNAEKAVVPGPADAPDVMRSSNRN